MPQFTEEMSVRGTGGEREDVWNGNNKEDLAKVRLSLGSRLRPLIVDLAIEMDRSPLVTKGDIRDVARVDTCALRSDLRNIFVACCVGGTADPRVRSAIHPR
jgi:hypothetical protein